MTVRDNAEYKLRDGLAGFNARNVKLPTAVTEAVQHWQAIKDRTPEGQAATAIRDAVMAGADDDEIDRLLLHDLGSNRLRSAYNQAAISAAVAALGAVMDARADIHAQLSKLADDAIDKLTTVAALGDTSLDSLVRGGHTDEARLFADRALTGSELHALFGLRDSFLYPGGLKAARVGHIDCTQWRDEAAVEGAKGATVVDRFISGLRAGGVLWFPSAEQAVAAAQPIFDKRAAEAQRKRQAERGITSVAAFW